MTIKMLEAENRALRKALAFYANGEHFARTDANAWDTVSGEPSNFWCDIEGTATVEDGSIASMVLKELSATRARAFTVAVKGINASSVASALTSMTNGVNWSGCSKGHMAECFAQGSAGLKSDPFGAKFDLAQLRRRSQGAAEGTPGWKHL